MHVFELALCAITCLLIGATLFGIDVQGAQNQTVVTTAETLAAFGAAVTLPSNTGKAAIFAWVQLNVSAGTTGVTLKLYRGPVIGGPHVNTMNLSTASFTAGQIAVFTMSFTDVLSSVSAAQYCISVTCTGASGNSTVVSSTLRTMVLSG